jgi:hypothetical protein
MHGPQGGWPRGLEADLGTQPEGVKASCVYRMFSASWAHMGLSPLQLLQSITMGCQDLWVQFEGASTSPHGDGGRLRR